uniref:Immunoglobulin domain-containing protein n=1 Tax=Dicentrarchus labrax TaxID=13489 RepID=A0A8C4GVY1_DICLA
LINPLRLCICIVAGIHNITTVSEVSVKAGDSITIPCLYESKYINHVKFLCKGYTWTSCSYAVKTNQPSSGKFLISDDKSQRIFTVTINDLTDEDTDYWCAVEIDEGSDVREYFHLSVTRGKRDLKASLWSHCLKNNHQLFPSQLWRNEVVQAGLLLYDRVVWINS